MVPMIPPPPNPCCCSCDVCNDSFTGLSDGTDVTTGTLCGYTEVSGSWTLVSATVQVTGTYAALTVDAAVPIGCYVSCQTGFATTTSPRILFDFVDNDNYLAAEVYRISTNRVRHRIIRRTAGVETVLREGNEEYIVTLSGAQTFIACYDEANSRFSMLHSGPTWAGVAFSCGLSVVTSVTTAKVGFGTGAVGSTNVAFDVIDINKSKADTESGGCSACPGCTSNCSLENLPDIEVDIPALIDAACSSCADYEATYVLEFTAFGNSTTFGSGQLCIWRFAITSPSCTYGYLHLTKVGTTWDVYLTQNNTSAISGAYNFFGGYVIWWRTTSGPSSCDAFDEFTIPHSSNTATTGASGLNCEGTGLDITVRLA